MALSPDGIAPSLRQHLDRECGCSRHTNPRGCLYQMFLDGWDYTPDAGNGQSRGEVFTPRVIVDYMISQAGIMPPEIVYDGAYAQLARADKSQALKLMRAKVYEPAVGTGNFISTILFHKLGLAHACSIDEAGGQLDVDAYQHYLLEAVGSCYASDIDPGNLQTTWWRILRDGSPILHETSQEHWVNVITSLAHSPRSVERASAYAEENEAAYQRVTDHVVESLAAAQSNWAVLETDDGLLEQMYKEHTSRQLPKPVKQAVNGILSRNLRLFDSLSSTDDELCPGSQSVHWYEWTTEHRKLRKQPLRARPADADS
jgi:hypothetical protein